MKYNLYVSTAKFNEKFLKLTVDVVEIRIPQCLKSIAV